MTKIFLDTADLRYVEKYIDDPKVVGFTTNPTLMRKSGVVDYLNFARQYIDLIKGRPLSLEVFADTESEMIRQALILGKLSKNIYVKIPIFFTDGSSTIKVIRELSKFVNLNITAITHVGQLQELQKLEGTSHRIIYSFFAGRVADAGYDFLQIASELRKLVKASNVELLWASTREIFNLKQANEAGFDIITIPPDLLEKINYFGKNLDTITVETVKMFYNDAINSQFQI